MLPGEPRHVYNIQEMNAHSCILINRTGVSPDGRGEEDVPLVLAAEGGYASILQLLLDAGANANAETQVTQAVPVRSFPTAIGKR